MYIDDHTFDFMRTYVWKVVGNTGPVLSRIVRNRKKLRMEIIRYHSVQVIWGMNQSRAFCRGMSTSIALKLPFVHVAYCERLGKIFSWWILWCWGNCEVKNICKNHRQHHQLQVPQVRYLLTFNWCYIHCTTFFVASLSFLDQVRLQSVCFLLSTKVGFGMSNLQASLRRTSSCPFRDCCSRWARDPNSKKTMPKLWLEGCLMFIHVWCLPSRVTWAMLSAVVSPSVSGVFEIRHLKISGYKADMVRSMQWRISDSFDVVCSKFSLSILILFDDFKGCWSCAAQSWRGVSRWKDSVKIYQKTISTKHEPEITETGNAQHGMQRCQDFSSKGW